MADFSSLVAAFGRGLILGGLGLFVIQVVLGFYLYNKFFKSKTEELPPPETGPSTVPHVHVEPWPENIVEKVRMALTSLSEKSSKTTETESCHWANIILYRFFIELRASQLYKEKTLGKISERLNAKIKGNSFISQINFKELDLGVNSPHVHGIRLIQEISEDMAVVAEADVSYAGGASVVIETCLTGGLKIPVKITVSSFQGHMRVRVPSFKWTDMTSIWFTEDPGVTFHVESSITVRESEMVKDMVNKLLGKIFKKVFMETWVYPQYRDFFLPLMQPPLDQIVSRSRLPGQPSKYISSKSSLSPTESKSLDLKITREGPPDALQDKCFPITTLVEDSNVPLLEAELVKCGLEILRTENNSDGWFPSTQWKIVKTKADINSYKGTWTLSDGKVAEVSKTTIPIKCPMEKVFSILSNPAHLYHVDDYFQGSNIVKQISDETCVRSYAYQFNKQGSAKDYYVFEKKKQVSETVSLVIQRTVAGWKTAKDLKIDPVAIADTATFIFIYYIEKTSESSCLVTCIASFGLSISKRDTGVTLGTKIKSFIEEFASISAGSKKEDVAKQLEEIPKGNSQKQLRIDKIKSVTKNILMKGGSKVTSWIGSSATSSSPQRVSLQSTEEEKDLTPGEIQSTTESEHPVVESVVSVSNTNLSDKPISMTSLELSSFDGGSPKQRRSVSEAERPLSTLSPPPIPPRRSSFEMSVDKEVRINVNLSEEESNSSVELFWEFVTTADTPVVFSILFTPSKDDKKEYIQYLEQGYTTVEKALFPSAIVHAYQYPSRGNVSVGCFPSGSFTFIWESSQKSGPIPVTYQCKLRPFSVPKPIGGVKDDLSNYNSCLEGEISISRRSLVKIPIIYDWNMDADLNSDQPSIEGFELGMHTNLEWEFGTNGSDIQFGIFFSSAAEELPAETEPIKKDPEPATGSPSITSYLSRSYTEFRSPSSTLPKGKAFVPMSKCNSQKSLVSGSMAITSRFGVYTCVFDNTASTLLNRRVKYRIRTVTHIL